MVITIRERVNVTGKPLARFRGCCDNEERSCTRSDAALYPLVRQ